MHVHLTGKKIFVALVSILLCSFGCKKATDAKTADILEQYFEQNVLNRDFKVNLATDTARILTPQYDGYIFRLEKDGTTNSNTTGPMTSKKNGIVSCTGTWACTEEFGKLNIHLTQPAIPAEFIFINRDWRFTEKAFPVMKLAPWGNTAPKVLYMERLQ